LSFNCAYGIRRTLFVAISRLIYFGKQVWNVRDRKRGGEAAQLSANTD
jgi:hypothetical protein